MFSTTHDVILLILAGGLAVWQWMIILSASAMLRSGQYRTVKVGLLPCLISMALLIVAALW